MAPKVVVFKNEIEAGAKQLQATLLERMSAHYPHALLDDGAGGRVKVYQVPEAAIEGVIQVAFLEGAALAQAKTLETVDQVMKGKPGRA